MAVFSYKALNGDDVATTGVLTADSPRQARDLLRARGLVVEEVRGQRGPAGGRSGTGGKWAWLGLGPRRHPAKVVSFVRELATLLGAGLPLLDAMDTILKQHAGAFRGNLLAVRDFVAAGGTLADAMRGQPALFDELYVNITEVGESAGTLDAALEQLADFKERSASLKNRVVTALTYPAVVLVMAVGVAVLLMTMVVPNLLASLSESGRPLPWATRVVKAASDALVGFWWLALIGVGLVFAAASAVLASAGGKRAWHRWQLRVPVVGDLLRKQAVVRIAVVMSALLRSGIPFVRAVEVAGRATKNLTLKDALARCGLAVTRGQDIGDALADTAAFPPVVVQIFAVGQHSGRLEEMLDRLAKDYDRQLSTAAQRLTTILEPLLILVMVVLVGFIAFATILPMLEAADAF
jgi:general secretion pathway protein F